MKESENWVARCQQTPFRELFKVTTRTLRTSAIVVYYLWCKQTFLFNKTHQSIVLYQIIQDWNVTIRASMSGFSHPFFIILRLYYYFGVLCTSSDLLSVETDTRHLKSRLRKQVNSLRHIQACFTHTQETAWEGRYLKDTHTEEKIGCASVNG